MVCKMAAYLTLRKKHTWHPPSQPLDGYMQMPLLLIPTWPGTESPLTTMSASKQNIPLRNDCLLLLPTSFYYYVSECCKQISVFIYAVFNGSSSSVVFSTWLRLLQHEIGNHKRTTVSLTGRKKAFTAATPWIKVHVVAAIPHNNTHCVPQLHSKWCTPFYVALKRFTTTTATASYYTS